MVIPLAMLAILAFVVIRSLMGVVAHEEGTPMVAAADTASPAFARAHDDARGLLLPAVADAASVDVPAVDLTAVDTNAS